MDTSIVAWLLLVLGIGHVVFGLISFRGPLRDAVTAGFVGKFEAPEVRRTAFWFTLFGLPLMLAGQVAVRAAAVSNLGQLKLVGWYVLVTSLIGAVAFPKSPFWFPLALSPLLIAAGYGWLP